MKVSRNIIIQGLILFECVIDNIYMYVEINVRLYQQTVDITIDTNYAFEAHFVKHL